MYIYVHIAVHTVMNHYNYILWCAFMVICSSCTDKVTTKCDI